MRDCDSVRQVAGSPFKLKVKPASDPYADSEKQLKARKERKKKKKQPALARNASASSIGKEESDTSEEDDSEGTSDDSDDVSKKQGASPNRRRDSTRGPLCGARPLVRRPSQVLQGR